METFRSEVFGNIRTLIVNNIPCFVAIDIARALEFLNPLYNIEHYVYHGDKGVEEIDGRKETIVNESGLYSLVASSKSPKAQNFKNWIVKIVIPKMQEPPNTDMQIFNNENFGEIRTLTIDDEPWFVGKDIASILGYEKERNAIARHVDGEDKKYAPIKSPLGGTQKTTIINESGLYSLILSSKLPMAKQFKRWITREVLPNIRKHGAHMTEATIEEILTKPETIIKIANNLKTAQEKTN